MANNIYVLGINGGLRLGYQDVSAVLLKNGEIIAAIEEERVIREKHASGRLSEKSILEVLRIGGITIGDVDVVATHGSTWGDDFEEHLKDYFNHRFGHVPTIERHHHHECHAASAFYASGFDSALTFTADGSGDGSSSRIYNCRIGKMELVAEFKRPHSLGIFYSVMTQYCGFVRDSDEYKLMGLAPYGNPDAFDLSNVLQFSDGRFSLDEGILRPILPGKPQTTKQERAFSTELITLFGNVQPRLREQAMDAHYMNVAASAQQRLQQVMVKLIGYWLKKTGNKNLCLAGGVALNCAANKCLSEALSVERFFVQPASSDAGISLGAAYLSSLKKGIVPQAMNSVALGRSYSDHKIREQLDLFGLNYERVDPATTAAKLISQGRVIGWFQGREEFGPRALGQRSILASAEGGEMKSRINSKIKFRESFRPFCPSIIEEDFKLHFDSPISDLPFMTINVNVREPKRFPAISHIDGTARVQTVSKEVNPLYHHMLTQLKEITGVGMCVNTSFNRSNEPIAGSPRDAISIFFGSGLDALVIGSFMVTK